MHSMNSMPRLASHTSQRARSAKVTMLNYSTSYMRYATHPPQYFEFHRFEQRVAYAELGEDHSDFFFDAEAISCNMAELECESSFIAMMGQYSMQLVQLSSASAALGDHPLLNRSRARSYQEIISLSPCCRSTLSLTQCHLSLPRVRRACAAHSRCYG